MHASLCWCAYAKGSGILESGSPVIGIRRRTRGYMRDIPNGQRRSCVRDAYMVNWCAV